MHDPREWSFLIPAAGEGIRLGLGAKAFIVLDGRSLIERAVEKAARVACEVVIAVPNDAVDAIAAMFPACIVVAGGTTRQNTVGVLLEQTTRDWVLVHDVARPFASLGLMHAVADAAHIDGTACAFTPVERPMAIVEGDLIVAHFRGDRAGLVESPLAFRKQILVEAHAFAMRERFQAQSTAELILAAGFPMRTVPGERDNIKITLPEDLPIAKTIAARIG